MRRLADFPEPPSGSQGWPWTEVPPPPPDIQDIAWPSITVICPSFNQGPFVEESFRSLLLQGYPNLQMVVMDGGSKDETLAVAKKYRDFIDIFVSEPDRGVSDALNKALERATGEVICWLNTDDLQEPGALFRAGRVFATDPSARWVCGSCEVFQEGQGPGELRTSTDCGFLGDWMFECQVQTPACFWARDLHEQVGNFDERFSFMMDTDLFMRFVLNDVKATILKEKLAALRLHPVSKSGGEADGFRRDGVNLMMPKYYDELPPGEQRRAKRLGARKLLRIASLEFQNRKFPAALNHILQAGIWSPRSVASAFLSRNRR